MMRKIYPTGRWKRVNELTKTEISTFDLKKIPLKLFEFLEQFMTDQINLISKKNWMKGNFFSAGKFEN